MGSFFVTISDLVKINAQLDLKVGSKRRTPRVIVRDIYAENGLTGFLRGWTMVIMRDVPGFGAYFRAYSF